MADNYTALYYHFVWGTKGRHPFVDRDLERLLFDYINRTCVGLKIRVLALNGMPDHVHLACSLPTTVTVADALHQIKGGSARFINGLPGDGHFLAWHPGYGALTFANTDLNRVIQYIQNQKRHHADKSLWADFEISAGIPESPTSQR